ncbi:hypothetical protein [Sulfobacillus harzensis]|uniref:Uncharacterized protein n=1 Tax=Sulfobacillus harzensis TaxID=2729629 RepID=A0A7Y0L637_9FIRM|nr:hypothetical protein [Sulfobacillus harzensis]NMP22599.1 hypothetical protein [Sulfobacillus harzensis]
MDAIGVLLEMGFLAHGKPKGFRLEPNRLTIWAEGPGAEAGVRDATATLGPAIGNEWSLASDGHRVQAEVSWPSQPAVWIVAQNPALGEKERRRWEGRGYPAQLVSSPGENTLSGLVVAVHENGLGYRGQLPRHPGSGAMVQSWH